MKTLAINKRAKYDYALLDTYEGGLVLTGQEVKSAKLGHAQLKGAFMSVRGEELWLKNTYIAPYKHAGVVDNYDPNHDRKVLVHKKEIRRLIGKSNEQGLTIVPIRLYTKGGKIKIKFALGKGKKQYEKRDAIKKRESDRDIRARLKSKQR